MAAEGGGYFDLCSNLEGGDPALIEGSRSPGNDNGLLATITVFIWIIAAQKLVVSLLAAVSVLNHQAHNLIFYGYCRGKIYQS